MKKRLIWVMPIIVVFILVVVLNYKWIYYRIYPFDRITVTYSVNVNGESVSNISEYYEYETGGKIRLESDTQTFKIKGGKYGRYEIGFVLGDDELYKLTNDEAFIGYGDVDLSIVYFETNWWHITNIDININLVEESNEWYVCYDVEYADETESNDEIILKESRKIKLSEVPDTDIIIGI